MSLKENIDAVKQEISTEEQFLESIIKGERFFKKYKKIIIVLVAFIVVASIAYAAVIYIHQNQIEKANVAYASLLKNPKDETALATLKSNDERLYNLFLFTQAINNNNTAELEKLSKLKSDSILADIASYQLASDNDANDVKSELLRGMALLHVGYKFLLEGKVKEAKLQFAQIAENSPAKNVANNLEHYQGK